VLVGVGGNSAMPSNLPETLTAVTLLRFSPEVSPLPVAWTLIHELAFYTLFGLMVWKFRVGLLVLAAWAALCLAVFHYPWEGEITAWQSYTAACNLYFLFGMGAWLLYRQAGTGLYEASLGVGVCCVGAWAFDMELRHAPLVMVTGFALLIAGAAKLERAGWLRAPRALAFTGDASYSLYLLHLPFSGVLLKLAVKGGALQALGHETTYLLVLAGTVALSCAAYVLVERPLVRRLRDRPWKGERSSAVLPATVQSA